MINLRQISYDKIHTNEESKLWQMIQQQHEEEEEEVKVKVKTKMKWNI